MVQYIATLLDHYDYNYGLELRFLPQSNHLQEKN